MLKFELQQHSGVERKSEREGGYEEARGGVESDRKREKERAHVFVFVCVLLPEWSREVCGMHT
jgi:hypothetical protein